jgi:folylpolyglutamate synthase/dihydropteroate synthase
MTSELARSLTVEPNPQRALDRALALASPEDAVFATGSLYLVGEWREYWRSRKVSAVTKS